MKKKLADILTGSRIVISFALLGAPVGSVFFYILYTFCGFTDMIDGTIARKTHSESKTGALLDSIADIVFLAVCAIKLLPIIHLKPWMWAWMIVVMLIKLINMMIGILYKKEPLFPHTILNKLTGFCIFVMVFFCETSFLIHMEIVACVLATIAALQESYLVFFEGKKGHDSISIEHDSR